MNDHPGLKTLFNQLPSSIKSEIVDAVGNKTVSYALVSFGQDGGSEVFVFPYNFTGVNGEPNTLMQGTYKVMFAYLSWEITGGEGCRLFEKDFACTSFFVVPEVPLGSVVSLLAMLAAFPALKYRKHIRLHKKA